MREMDKKTQAAMRDAFALHVAVIMRQDKVTKAKAQWIAWCEGEQGLARRMNETPLLSATTAAPK